MWHFSLMTVSMIQPHWQMGKSFAIMMQQTCHSLQFGQIRKKLMGNILPVQNFPAGALVASH